MNTAIFVITHKETHIPNVKGLIPLLVGAENHPNIKCYENTDNTGDNISLKNKNYCELTGIYWMWKNINAEIIGICHYRRFFTNAKISVNTKYFCSSRDFEKMMSRYDVIVPNPRYYTDTVINSVNIAPNKADMQELEKAINVVCPEYNDAYIQFINGKKSYLYNMCVMKKTLFNSYCKWLFEILEYIENDYDISNESEYRQRLYGFLSERLIGVWLLQNVPASKIKQCRVVKTDESMLRSILHDLKNVFRYIAGRF